MEFAHDLWSSHRPNINIHCLHNTFITVWKRIGMTPSIPQCMSCQEMTLSNKMRIWEGPAGIVIYSDVHYPNTQLGIWRSEWPLIHPSLTVSTIRKGIVHGLLQFIPIQLKLAFDKISPSMVKHCDINLDHFSWKFTIFHGIWHRFQGLIWQQFIASSFLAKCHENGPN